MGDKKRYASCAVRYALKTKDYFLCLLSAILLILSSPNYNLWIFAWIGFVPLFFVIQNKSRVKVFFFSYLTGVIFWFGIIYWLIHVTFIGLIVLVFYLALYFGIFGLFIAQRTAHSAQQNLFFIPSAWVILEYLRSHLFTGFPWALLGYSQYLNLPVIQIADITGAWGVSFLLMMVNVVVYSFCAMRYAPCATDKKQKKSLFLIPYLLPFLLLFLSLIYGFYNLRKAHSAQHTTLKISVIQPNIPQDLKWDTDARDSILDKYSFLTKQAVKDEPDLIIWPEASSPVVVEEEPAFFERIKDFVRELKRPLLLGAVTFKENQYYNSALFLSGEGKLLNQYDKLHLVPFGEYIPLRKIFSFLETVVPIGDLAFGRDYTVFTHSAIKFSVLICFEDIFPELAPEFVKNGAQLLLNITNDAWFGRTSSAYQHFSASVFRAVENRVYLVRCANTGVSGFIAPSGKIIALVQDKNGKEIFIDGYRTEEIAIPKRHLSFYTRYGDIFIVVCFLFMIYSIAQNAKRKAQN